MTDLADLLKAARSMVAFFKGNYSRNTFFADMWWKIVMLANWYF